MSNAAEKRTTVEIPVGYEAYDEGVVMFNNDETDKIIPKIGIVVQEDTIEGAREQYLKSLRIHIKYLERRAHKADCWIPVEFLYSSLGLKTFWIRIFGLHFYFRYGKGMKGGRYIPFTNLNISFTNYWRINYD